MSDAQEGTVLTTAVPIAVSILIATGGWIFTYFHKRRTTSRLARLDRVNQQLRLLYGPLYARLLAGSAAWQAFADRYWPSHGQVGFFSEGYETTDGEKARWRLWMKEVFHPLNTKLESLIVDHLDLMEDEEMPQAFVDTLSHIAVYHAVLKQWEDGDYSDHTSIINFPASELMEVVRPAYERLRQEQERLISDTQEMGGK